MVRLKGVELSTWDKFIFLLQIKGAAELGKMIDQSAIHIKCVANGERTMSRYMEKEINELYELREDCQRRTARLNIHTGPSSLEH